MLIQIAAGTVILLANILIAGLASLALELAFLNGHKWLMREPHRPKLVLLVAGVSLAVLGVVTAGVWTWALVYLALGMIDTLEAAVYFSLVTYTTVGFGDIVPGPEWRVLAAMEGANGFLTFGLLTALLVEALRQIRLDQVAHRKSPHS